MIRSIRTNIASELKKWKSYPKKEDSCQRRNNRARVQRDPSFWLAADTSWINDISCDAFASKHSRGRKTSRSTFKWIYLKLMNILKMISFDLFCNFCVGKVHRYWSRIRVRFNWHWNWWIPSFSRKRAHRRIHL